MISVVNPILKNTNEGKIKEEFGGKLKPGGNNEVCSNIPGFFFHSCFFNDSNNQDRFGVNKNIIENPISAWKEKSGKLEFKKQEKESEGKCQGRGTPDCTCSSEIGKKLERQKTNNKMLYLNPIILIIALNVNILNTLIKKLKL